MTEPKSCPFCGGKPHFNECSTLEGNFCMVACSDNYHSVLVSVTAETKEKARELAIKKWNRRHYPAAVVIAEKQTEYHPDGYVFLVRCPCCNSEINYIGYRLQETAVKHCGDCGKKMIIKFQTLDWSE